MKATLQKSEGDNEGTVPACFFQPQREVNMCSPAWWSPDPSPSRDAADLPDCAPSEIYDGAIDDARDDKLKTPRPWHSTKDQKHCSTAEVRTLLSSLMGIEILPVPEEELEQEVSLPKSHCSSNNEGAVNDRYT